MRLHSLTPRLCLLLALSLAAPTVHAAESDGPPPEAKKAFVDGKAAFERGEYELALQLFQRAALIAPAPSLYYNIGMAYERLGRFTDSAIAFEKYLQLIEPPQTEDEKAFQQNLKTRAAANRARAQAPSATPQPGPPLVEPSARPSAYPPYQGGPYYGVQPAPLPTMMVPPLTHQQKLDKARRHRNNGIALTVVGTVLTVAGVGLTAWVGVHPGFSSVERGLAYWGAVSPMIVGIPFLIPGAIAWAKWQKELTAETKRGDEKAPPPPRSALDDLPPLTSPDLTPRAVTFSAPAVSF